MPYIWERCPFAACMDRQRVNTKEIPTGESACTVCPLPCNRTGKRRQNRNSGSKICTRTSLVYQHLPNPWKAAPWIVSKPVRYALCIRYSTRGRVFFVSQILSTPTRVSPGRKGTYGQHVPEALLCSLRVRSCVCISPGKSPTWLRMETPCHLSIRRTRTLFVRGRCVFISPQIEEERSPRHASLCCSTGPAGVALRTDGSLFPFLPLPSLLVRNRRRRRLDCRRPHSLMPCC